MEPSADVLARRNTLGCLATNRDSYRAAGNAPMADLFAAAYERRLALLGAGAIQPCELYS